MGDEVEAPCEEGAEHGLDGYGRRAGGNLCADIEAVDFEPGGTAEDLLCIDAVSEADEVEHGGVAELVLASFETATEFDAGGGWAGADVRKVKAGGFGGLGGQYESGEEGQADCRKHISC